MNYRRDIDGLRALAVVPVVLYHAFPQWLTGGYVGVDVFFVISGFLITGLLINELDANRFSLLDFYERRARRILPALAVVLLFTYVACWLLYLPDDFRKFSGSLLATGGFASNFFFWRTSGYFDGDVEIQPLLHTWSLAVEEQFYLFFPLLLAAVAFWMRRHLVTVLATLCVSSLAASIVLTELLPQHSFYLLPTRAWELMLGALLAVRAVPASSRTSVNDVLAGSGVLLMGYSMFAYTRETAFPGYAAIAPALGAALVILAGIGGQYRLRPILESRLVVGIGLISYSLYLWHWPLLALLRYYAIDSPSVASLVLVVLAAFAAAGASWRWVENPIRRRKVFARRASVFTASAAFMALCIGFGALGYLTRGLPQRLPADIAALSGVDTSSKLRSADRNYCLQVNPKRLKADELCVMGSKSAAPGPSFLLWGDSHAETFRAPLADLAVASGQWGYFLGGSGCPPLLGVRRYDKEGGDGCTALNDAIIAWLGRHEIRTVFMVARWALNMTGDRYGEERGARAQLSPEGAQSNAVVVAAALRQTVSRLTALGIKVVLISGVPEVGLDVPRTLALQRYLHKTSRLVPTLEEYLQRNASSLQLLQAVSQEFPNVGLVHPYQKLCPVESGVCQVEIGGSPLYSDDDHLSLTGARYLTEMLRPAFATADLASSLQPERSTP